MTTESKEVSSDLSVLEAGTFEANLAAAVACVNAAPKANPWSTAPKWLVDWARTQTRPRSMRRHSEARRNALEEANLPPLPPAKPASRFQADAWDETRKALDLWVKKHGNALVPQMAKIDVDGKPFPVGVRVSSLRQRRSSLPDEVVRHLEALPGWVWRTSPAHWDRRITRVEQCAQSDDWNGRITHLPTGDYRWLQRQMRARPDLPAPQRKRLDKFLSNHYRPPGVESLVAAAKHWLSKDPTRTMADVTARTVVKMPDGTDFLLGSRVIYYRGRYAGTVNRTGGGKLAPLSAEDVDLIESLPGWTWESPWPHTARP